jgi:hypothetical protein
MPLERRPFDPLTGGAKSNQPDLAVPQSPGIISETSAALRTEGGIHLRAFNELGRGYDEPQAGVNSFST